MLLKVCSDQCSCSEVPDKLWVRQGSVHQMLRFCLSTGGLCCFVLLHLDQGPSHRLGRPRSPSVCHVLFCCKTLAVNRLCFLSFITSLNIFHYLYLYLCSSLLPSASFPPLSFNLHLAPPPLGHLCLSDFTFVISPPPSSPLAFAVLWRPTEAIRTDGLRWFPGSTHFYRKQPGTVAGMMLSSGVCRSKIIKIQSSAEVFKAEFSHYVLVWIIFGSFRLILTQLWNSGPYPVYFGVSKYDVLILTWHLQTPCIFCLILSLLVLFCHICVAFVLAVLVVRRLLTVGKCHFPCDPSKWYAIACRLYTHPSVLFIYINQRSCYVCICMCQSVEYKTLGLRHNLHLFLLASWRSWCFT